MTLDSSYREQHQQNMSKRESELLESMEKGAENSQRPEESAGSVWKKTSATLAETWRVEVAGNGTANQTYRQWSLL